MKKHLLLLLFCTLLFACHKEKKLTEVDYLVVGYANFSWGNNCEIYKITPYSVFADSSTCAQNFATLPLADEKFQRAKTLLESIPEQLLTETKTNFLCEGCYDSGGYSIEFQIDGKIYQFSMAEKSNDPHYLPDYLRKFKGQIERLLKDL